MLPLACCAPDTLSITDYYQRHFLRKAISVYDWTVPDYWNFDYFIYNLYVKGYVAVIYTNEYGLIPQECGLLGWKVMQEPEGVFIGTQFVQINHRSIGDRCELFRINADMTGMMDTINMYAGLCAELMSGIFVNIKNSKLSYLIPVDDKKIADNVKRTLDAIYGGEPAVIFDKNIKPEEWNLFFQNVSQTYVVDKMLSDLRKIENDFDTRIGINNTNVEKKERMITDEVNSNNGDTMAEAWERLERLKKSCDSINNQFGDNIMNVEFNKKVVNIVDGSANTDIARDVSV